MQLTVGAKKTISQKNNLAFQMHEESTQRNPSPKPRNSRSIATLLENEALTKNKVESQVILNKSKVLSPNHAMAKETDRDLSFQRGWPLMNPPTSKIVQAGFYFEPTESQVLYDRTRCFACGIEVNNWLPNDQPLVRHLMQNHDCPHVQKIIVPELRQLLVKLKREEPKYQTQQLIGKGSFGEVKKIISISVAFVFTKQNKKRFGMEKAQ